MATAHFHEISAVRMSIMPGLPSQGTTYMEICDNTGICTKVTSLNDAAVAELSASVDSTYLSAFTGEERPPPAVPFSVAVRSCLFCRLHA